ncbi:MAG TPA: hypothetical protein VFE46_05820 [Pirellulales bacterium]|jgi:hypothetical protein|nr:hypothetical protein [Pirellulales bacterium]
MHRKFIPWFFAAIGLLSCSDSLLALAKPHVEMEVIFEPGLAGNTMAQKWTKVLGDLGLGSVRFRALENGDQMGIATQGTGDTAVYEVTAQLNSHGALITPGGQFTLSDTAKLKQWLDQVAAGGGKPGGQSTAFGLSAKQFDDVKQALAVPIGFSTKGLRPEKVIERLQTASALPLTIDLPIQKALAADDAVRDELQGLSLGTALAALTRPAGGALLPRNGRNGLELKLTTATASGEMWPIGWPPEERDESKVVPKLFEFTPVETDGSLSAGAAIDAIQAKLAVPFLFDYNGLVRKRIDLKKPVKVTAGKTYFRRILDRVLFQAGLKAEVRLDDAGKPLVWITPL